MWQLREVNKLLLHLAVCILELENRLSNELHLRHLLIYCESVSYNISQYSGVTRAGVVTLQRSTPEQKPKLNTYSCAHIRLFWMLGNRIQCVLGPAIPSGGCWLQAPSRGVSCTCLTCSD